MTVIAAVHDGERYAIAGDSWITMGPWGRGDVVGGKVWRYGAWLFGFADVRMQAERAKRWMETQSTLEQALDDNPVEALELLHQHLLQWAPQAEPGKLRFTELDLLAVGPSGIWRLTGVGEALRHSSSFAIGNADDFAMGVLWTLEHIEGVLPTDAVCMAVEGACRHFDGCRGPVEVLDHHLLGG